MRIRLRLVLLFVVLAACSVAPPSGPATPDVIVVLTARPTETPKPTFIPVYVPTATPTATPNPTPAPRQLGSFVVTRRLQPGVAILWSLPQVPVWFQVGTAEAEALAVVERKFLGTWWGWEGNTYGEEADFLASAMDYLARFPDSDGAILVLILQGHRRNFLATYNGADLSPVAQEYERAMRLLLREHPERRTYFIDDLVDLGIPIDWAQSTDLGYTDLEVLLFTYNTWNIGHGPGRLFALMHVGSEPWTLTQLLADFLVVHRPYGTPYDRDANFAVEVLAIDDLDADSEEEVVVMLRYLYFGGTWGSPPLVAARWQVLGWRQGHWDNLIDLHASGELLQDEQGLPGELWIDDANGDGFDELVMQYPLGALNEPLSKGRRGIDIYQWDGHTFTDTLPITFGNCAYQALAEVQRLHGLQDWRGMLLWLHEFRQRARAEIAWPGSPCAAHFQGKSSAWSVWDTSRSYALEIAALEQLLGPSYEPVDTCPYYAGIRPEHGPGFVEIPRHAEVTEFHLGQTLKDLEINVVRCDSAPPRTAARLQWPDPGNFDDAFWEATCTAAWEAEPVVQFIPGDNGEPNLLQQTTSWSCGAVDQPLRWTTTAACQWNIWRYVKLSGNVVSIGSEFLTPEQQDRLLQVTDCTGIP